MKITSDKQHGAATIRLDRLLFDHGDGRSYPCRLLTLGENLAADLLAEAIEAYEKERWPISEPAAEALAAFRAEQEGRKP